MFRAQEDERRRLKSLQQISKMKARMMTKKIDHDLMRWDPRTCRFVEDTGAKVKSIPAEPMPDSSSTHTIKASELRKRSAAPKPVKTKPVVEGEWSRANKDTARTLAELNGVWKPEYEKLGGGLLVMTVTNRLKGLVKKGGVVKWT